MAYRQAVGGWGEKRAAAFLSQKGYTLLASNVRTPYGEIDLLARQGQVLVFVEVKTRTSSAFGSPEEAVTPKKRAHLIQSAQAYLQAHPEVEDDWRIDVIAIRRLGRGRAEEIIHFENAVTG
jgi:putative endonuclease